MDIYLVFYVERFDGTNITNFKVCLKHNVHPDSGQNLCSIQPNRAIFQPAFTMLCTKCMRRSMKRLWSVGVLYKAEATECLARHFLKLRISSV